MVALLHSAKRVAPLTFAVFVSVLVGCGDDDKGSKAVSTTSVAGSTSSVSVSAVPQGGYDISRIKSLKNSFPQGYTVEELPDMTLSKEDMKTLGGIMSETTYDPPQCNQVAQPLPAVGARTQGLSAKGEQKVSVVALLLDQPVPYTPPPAGCEHFTFTSPLGKGTGDRITAPAIDGVDTFGITSRVTTTQAGGSESTDQVMYFAHISDQVAVIVLGEKDSPLLQDLLVKGVNAARGR
jgi:hypothetical protein